MHRLKKKKNKKRDFLLVDGYNIIFAWDDLTALADESFFLARDKLIHQLSNYAGRTKKTIILVFDAHQTKEPPSVSNQSGIWVVYTAYAETADEYIEKTTRALSKEDAVTVATSDGLEQIIIIGYGARVFSASDLLLEIETSKSRIKKEINETKSIKNNIFIELLDPETAKYFEDLRRQ